MNFNHTITRVQFPHSLPHPFGHVARIPGHAGQVREHKLRPEATHYTVTSLLNTWLDHAHWRSNSWFSKMCGIFALVYEGGTGGSSALSSEVITAGILMV